MKIGLLESDITLVKHLDDSRFDIDTLRPFITLLRVKRGGYQMYIEIHEDWIIHKLQLRKVNERKENYGRLQRKT